MTPARIRSITVGLDPSGRDPSALAPELADFCAAAEGSFDRAGFEVQTRRLVLPPVRPTDAVTRYSLGSRMNAVSELAEAADIRWMCLPISCAPGWQENELVQAATEIAARYKRVFLHFMLADNYVVYDGALNAFARAVLAISRLSPNGFDNFRVGAGCNIRPNTPFFPFSYHEGKDGFSIAAELIGQVCDVVDTAVGVPFEALRERLVSALSETVARVGRVATELESSTGWEFKGVDISLAPYPDERRSVAALVERLGPEHAGQNGTLAATAFLTNVLKASVARAGVRSTGFNGVMYAPLEDRALAASNNRRHLSAAKLMLFSSVCGCGVDMVPLPGDVFPEEIESLVLDVATLSTVLRKPLGVRVLPIPLKAVNEMTDFNHDFLVNTRVMSSGGQVESTLRSSQGELSFLALERAGGA
jgi:uncharacterized protein (UPF0210 family)